MKTAEVSEAAVRERAAAVVDRHRIVAVFEGAALVILGLLALLAPIIASVAVTALFGWILLLAGSVGLVSSLRARHASGFTWSLLSALVGIAAGLLLLAWPLSGTLSLTVVLIVFLLVDGGASIVYALEHKRALRGRWGWMLASGLVDVLLGLYLLIGLPATALWALGLLMGISLLFGGTALILMALNIGVAPPSELSETAATP